MRAFLKWNLLIRVSTRRKENIQFHFHVLFQSRLIQELQEKKK